MRMATTTRSGIKYGPARATNSAQSLSSRRFLMVASLKPVSKRATITSAQADKVVRDYLDAHQQEFRSPDAHMKLAEGARGR